MESYESSPSNFPTKKPELTPRLLPFNTFSISGDSSDSLRRKAFEERCLLLACDLFPGMNTPTVRCSLLEKLPWVPADL